MWETVEDLIKSRGVQVGARYLGTLLVALGTKWAIPVKPEDAVSGASLIATFAAAGICMLIDHFSHAKQKEA